MSLGIVIAVIVLFVAFLRRRRYPKIKGMYNQEHGFWFGVKYVIAAVLFTIRGIIVRWSRRSSADLEQSDWESPDEFISNDKVAMNTWALIGGDKKGNVLLVRMCRRLEGRIEIWLILRLADGRTFTHPAHPETTVQDETPFGDEFEESYMAGAGMRFRALEPAKRFRFSYSGPLKLYSPDDKTLKNDGIGKPQKMVEVDLRVWYRASADLASYSVDAHPLLLARTFASENWSELLQLSFKAGTSGRTPHNQQMGDMRGFVKIADIDTIHLGEDKQPIERLPLSLHGMRNRTRGRRDWNDYRGYLAHFGMIDNGRAFSLTALSGMIGLSHIQHGFFMEPNGIVYGISWTDIHLANFPEWPANLPIEYELHFVANGKMYTLKVRRLSAVPLPHGEDWPVLTNLSPARFEINGVVGHGNVEYQHRNDDRLVPPKTRPGIGPWFGPKAQGTGLVRNLPIPLVPKTDGPFCVSLDEPLSCLSGVTGGKVAKLAMVKQASCQGVDFTVPDGFAVTVNAFEKQLRASPELRKALKRVVTVTGTASKQGEWRLVNPRPEQIKEACDNAVGLFNETPLAEEVRLAIVKKMEAVFGSQWDETFVAVRSSSVGEDSGEASAAGQMVTHLHIRGEEAVCRAIRRCWASNFDYRAVQYRRQICTNIDPPVGVLVQRLVAADTAGVMFTRDPRNGSTARLIINASFGLGEDVVSGAVEPDTITVLRHNIIEPDCFDVVHTRIGDKTGDTRHKCCLSEGEVRRLAKVGIEIERMFGTARDIEWAFSRDKQSGIGETVIHILQARPVTTIDKEEDWELEHEFDSPLGSQHEWITNANLREMMPGALTPLSVGIWQDLIGSASESDSTFIGLRTRRRIPIYRTMNVFYQHPFINYTYLAGMAANEAGLQMAIFGERKPEFPPLVEMQEYMSNTSKFWHIISDCVAIYRVLFPESVPRKLHEDLKTTYPPHACDPDVLYQQIVATVPTMRRGFLSLAHLCSRPVTLQFIMMKLLEPNAEAWSSREVGDLAILLSSCPNVYTADVPTQVREIAETLAKTGCREKFLAMDDHTAAEWLLSTDSQIARPGQMLKKLLAKHGHRCVRESELRETCWRQEPEKVITAVRTILGATQNADQLARKKQETTVDEAIDALSRPITGLKRKIMKWLLPMTRQAVGKREWGKSLAIQSLEAGRVACHRLGVILTERGYLPDPDLVFFVSLPELGRLIQRRSAKLIFKALRRRRLFERLDQLQFDEITCGYPKPCDNTTDTIDDQSTGNLIVKGIPVGNGSVEGVARVLSSYEESNTIQNGEILIVPCTDVGWTPFFPLISGLVTEMGGLLSHGAVVAREYGLPCLVGCKNATRTIPNGARVRIDGSTASLIVLE